jgi:diketogulonate reductase-like aldo/keto reductase
MKKIFPKIFYGTAWKKEKTTELVTKALEKGYRAIDTACQLKHYNEKGVGDAINLFLKSNKRDDLYIQTKFTPISGHDINEIPYNPSDPLEKQVQQSFERSLQNLQVNHLDSLVLHSPLLTNGELMKVWRGMENICINGGSNMIGISNCYDIKTLEYLMSNSKVQPKILQNRFYSESDYDNNLREYCKYNDIFYQSFWTLTANPHLVNCDFINKLSKVYKKTNEQIFLKFLSSLGIIPIVGTTSEIHMVDDLDEFILNENDFNDLKLFFYKIIR